LVLLHCLGQTHRFWDVFEPLTDKYELIAYSFPGHGDTPLPTHPYGGTELVEQLKAVADREGLTKFSLMGISLGGSIAQEFAGTYPAMVDKLVLADCTPRYTEEARANWPVRAKAARENGVASLIPFLEKVFFTQASLDANTGDVGHVRQTFRECSGEAYALACECLATLDAREAAKKIIAPTLVMYGSNEGPAFVEAAAWMKDHIKDSRVEIIPQAGHASARERPAHVVALLRNFLG
jgi:pimeloyl-ACP methyl ester carboxylesterase